MARKASSSPSPPGDDAVPAYDGLQSAFHRTCRAELDRAIAGLWLPDAAQVLDAPCGNGFYARRLAAHVAPAGRVTAVDTNPAYLAQARDALAHPPARVRAEVVSADVYALPFPDATFDLAWCAQSLISLTDAVRALRELLRVTKPGGRVAVLEVDEFHHVLLPWPVELELAIQQAVYRVSKRRYGRGTSLSPARSLRRMLAEAGWTPTRKVTLTSDRQAPFRPWEADFLARHLAFLADLVRAELPADHRDAFDQHTRPDSDTSFLNRPEVELTCLNTLHLGRKPK